MASTEEEFSSFTTKGRRTKRQRFLVAASASSTYRGAGPADPGCSDINSFGSSSSDDHDVMSEVTTEEEDMANCLILLAQGVEKKGSSKSMIKAKISNNNNSNNNNNIIITSTSTSNNNINNIGVYECKTCNKTFPSFQALGGHRTSHKKVKPPPPTSTPIPSPDRHEDNREVVVDLADVMEFSNIKKIVVHDNNNKARVHECSICGSEFPSGQALGGHMRRHRAVAIPPPSSTTAVTVSPDAATVIDTGGPRNILSLDLNLPAPDDQDEVREDDDHHMETKFVHNVLPRPAPLVDCHY